MHSSENPGSRPQQGRCFAPEWFEISTRQKPDGRGVGEYPNREAPSGTQERGIDAENSRSGCLAPKRKGPRYERGAHEGALSSEYLP
eukprot:866232-Pleurochrysis_carterae.AAC.5